MKNVTTRERIHFEALTPIQPSPVEGEGSDPLLPLMGRTQEGCTRMPPLIFKGVIHELTLAYKG